MGIPISQMWTVARYVLGQRRRGRERYPLVMMLEPLFRCNLACAGCGKIQQPVDVLRRQLTPEQCFAAMDECGTPIVSIAGGEPLLHPQIDEIVAGLVARRKYIYLCTNAVPLVKKLDAFQPSKYLTLNVHMDGTEAMHDRSVCRAGVHAEATAAIREALRRGFRVTTNTTLFEGVDPNEVRRFFDEMTELGVEGMTISPGYAYPKAPDQASFLQERRKTRDLFRLILSNRKRGWKFNQSPLFLEFLMGRRDYECTPWGNPTYNLFGWQKPCYLLEDGHAASFGELLGETDWPRYGRASGNRACQQCLVHCGHEPTAVDDTFGSIGGFWRTVRALLRRRYPDPAARRQLEELARQPRDEPATEEAVAPPPAAPPVTHAAR